jgi:hypothetical protein
MSQITREIGTKQVYVSRPYVASTPPLIGRQEEMEMITAA